MTQHLLNKSFENIEAVRQGTFTGAGALAASGGAVSVRLLPGGTRALMLKLVDRT